MKLRMAAMLILLLIINSMSTPLFAQQTMSKNTVTIGMSKALLTGGDIGAQILNVSFERRILSNTEVLFDVGFLTSVNRDLYSVKPPALLGTFRERRHIFVNVGIEVMPLKLSIGDSRHQLGFKIAASGRHRWEEKAKEMYLPGFFETSPPEAVREILSRCGTSQVYCIDSYEANDNVPDGQYWLQTLKFQSTDLGGLAGIEYSVRYMEYQLGVQVGYWRYLNQKVFTGTHTMYFGLSLGYLF